MTTGGTPRTTMGATRGRFATTARVTAAPMAIPPATAPHHGSLRGRSFSISTAHLGAERVAPRRRGRSQLGQQLAGGNVGERDALARGKARLAQQVGELARSDGGAHVLLPQRHARPEDRLHEARHVSVRADLLGSRGALDGLRELEGRRVARVEIAGQGPGDHVVERLRDLRADLAERGDGAGHDVLQDVDGLFPAEQPPAGEALPEHHRHREHVALDRAHAPLVDALGREVRELALDLVGARRLDAILGLGDAEVGEQTLAVATQQNVVGRHVAVNDVQRLAVVVLQIVRGLQARQRVEHDAHRHANVDRATDGRQLAPQLGQGRPLDVIHDDERHAAVEPELAHLHDVGVLDGRGQARLVDQHGEKRLVALQVPVGSLHGHERRALALVDGLGQVHGGHSPRGQLEQQLVGAQAFGLRRGGRLSHVRRLGHE